MTDVQIDQGFMVGNSRQNITLVPSNNPASNSFFHEGANVISWEFPASNILLDPRSIRINGTLRFRNYATMGNDTTGQPIWKSINIDQYAASGSIFSAVRWASGSNGRANLESIRNYPQLLNCILPGLTTASDYIGKSAIESGASQNVPYANKSFIQAMANPNGTGAKVSMPVYTGLTLSATNNLAMLPLGGLILTAELNPDAAVFCADTSVMSATNLADIQYELHDMTISATTYQPTADERLAIANMKGSSISMNTFTSLFNVLQSNDNNSQFNLGIRELVAIFFKFNKTSLVNNLHRNEFQATRILNSSGETKQAVQLKYLRSGTEFPCMYGQDVLAGSNEAELQKFYIQALGQLNSTHVPQVSINNVTNDPRFAIGSPAFELSYHNQVKQLNRLNQPYGISYDMLPDSDSGANFNNRPLTIQILSDLTDATTNALYLFTLQKTTIMFGENGIQVLS